MSVKITKAVRTDRAARPLAVKVPRHVGIVMDGNRRWARERGLDELQGHEAGLENVRRIIDKAQEMGVTNLTLYAFSTENWKRTKKEIRNIFRLMLKFIVQERVNILKNNIKFRTIGDIKRFPINLRTAIRELMRVSARNNKFILNIALNYSGRSEIVRAVKSLLKKGARALQITEDQIAAHLDTAGQADPDLIIRTGGEQRLSNFMLWQASYSELYFSSRMVRQYQSRERRFGK